MEEIVQKAKKEYQNMKMKFEIEELGDEFYLTWERKDKVMGIKYWIKEGELYFQLINQPDEWFKKVYNFSDKKYEKWLNITINLLKELSSYYDIHVIIYQYQKTSIYFGWNSDAVKQTFGEKIEHEGFKNVVHGFYYYGKHPVLGDTSYERKYLDMTTDYMEKKEIKFSRLKGIFLKYAGEENYIESSFPHKGRNKMYFMGEEFSIDIVLKENQFYLKVVGKESEYILLEEDILRKWIEQKIKKRRLRYLLESPCHHFDEVMNGRFSNNVKDKLYNVLLNEHKPSEIEKYFSKIRRREMDFLQDPVTIEGITCFRLMGHYFIADEENVYFFKEKSKEMEQKLTEILAEKEKERIQNMIKEAKYFA